MLHDTSLTDKMGGYTLALHDACGALHWPIEFTKAGMACWRCILHLHAGRTRLREP